MSKNDCRTLVNHLSRIQGQIETLKEYLNEDQECKKVAFLLTSVAKSFDSLRASVVEKYIQREFIDDDELMLKSMQKMESLMKLIRA
jgi:DNA-binding FrmR family transcriptional regulator